MPYPLQLRTTQNQPIVFQTNGLNERFRITEDDRIVAFQPLTTIPLNYPAYNSKFIIHPGMNGNMMLFRVYGRGQKVNGTPGALNFGTGGASNNNFTLAEFVQSGLNNGDAGIRLQGSRQSCDRCDVAFIDFANYDNDETPNVIYNMARIAVGQQRTNDQLGYIRFYTNTGTDDNRGNNDAGLLERMRINGGGIGFFNLIPDGVPSNQANNTARFNIMDNTRPQLRLVQSLNNQNVANIYTNLQTTANGDLLIEPRDETQATANIRPRFVGIHTVSPGNTLEINSQMPNATTSVTPTIAGMGGGNVTGNSGLRFTDLNGNSTPYATNPRADGAVLGLSATGDVILVPGNNNEIEKLTAEVQDLKKNSKC